MKRFSQKELIALTESCILDKMIIAKEGFLSTVKNFAKATSAAAVKAALPNTYNAVKGVSDTWNKAKEAGDLHDPKVFLKNFLNKDKVSRYTSNVKLGKIQKQDKNSYFVPITSGTFKKQDGSSLDLSGYTISLYDYPDKGIELDNITGSNNTTDPEVTNLFDVVKKQIKNQSNNQSNNQSKKKAKKKKKKQKNNQNTP
jgi:hypothetical protein